MSMDVVDLFGGEQYERLAVVEQHDDLAHC